MLYIFILLIALAVFVIGWFVTKSVLQAFQSTREVEEEDLLLDSKFIASIYPYIHKVAKPFRRLDAPVVRNQRGRIRQMLDAAGMGDDLGADDVFGWMLLSGIFCGLYGALMGAMLGAGDLSQLPASETFLDRALAFLFGYFKFILPGFIIGALLPVVYIRDKKIKRQKEIRRKLPFALDLMTLAVEAGLDFTASLKRIADKDPKHPMSVEFQRLVREINMGVPRSDALKAMADRCQVEELTSVVSALVQADELGSSLGPILRIQGEQLRIRRFQLAEKKAMEAPVKMLFPLLAFIMPQVFIIIFAPLVLKVWNEGIL